MVIGQFPPSGIFAGVGDIFPRIFYKNWLKYDIINYYFLFMCRGKIIHNKSNQNLNWF